MQNAGNKFILHSDYQPTGDQPQAIEALVKGFREGNQFQTLLGVTGSGKTFTMANVIEQLQKSTLQNYIQHIGLYGNNDTRYEKKMNNMDCANRKNSGTVTKIRNEHL